MRTFMDKVVYWDCDGVFADLEPILLGWVRKINPSVKKITSYNMGSHGLTQEKLNAHLQSKAFARQIRTMNSLDGSIEGLNKLFNFLDESNILTFRNDEGGFYQGIEEDTSDWFELEGGKYNNLFFEKYKAEFINERRIGMLVEDSPYNIKSANKLGIPCICVPHGYNTEVKESPLVRIRNWTDDGSGKPTIEECVRNEIDWKNMRFD